MKKSDAWSRKGFLASECSEQEPCAKTLPPSSTRNTCAAGADAATTTAAAAAAAAAEVAAAAAKRWSTGTNSDEDEFEMVWVHQKKSIFNVLNPYVLGLYGGGFI
jgi:hypothetical protein